ADRSAWVAARLASAGVGPGDVVAVWAWRGAPLVQAVLGVLRAGAAFLILDPAYPEPRLATCAWLAAPKAWIVLRGAGSLPAGLEALAGSSSLRLELDGSHASAEPPRVETGPDTLAYVAFTSGSTGTPKGILGTHGPLSHFFDWHARTFGLGEEDRFSLLSGLAHDPLLRDLFTPLWIGAALCIPGAAEMDSPSRLAGWMARQRIRVSHLTPAMAQVIAQGGTALPELRRVFFGGDVLAGADLDRMRALAPGAEIVNFYGTTETPQAMSWSVAPEPLHPARRVPVGRGIDGVQLLVLGEAGGLAGVGELGEVCIRTPYLALGYLGDGELTAERFRTNPFTGEPDDRLYRTGDLGRYLANGEVDVAGRRDGQIKLRGFRVEPREIEAALAEHPAVREAVVRLDQGRRLGAWLVARGGSRPEAPALRSFLRARLPEFMVPEAFAWLERLPLTPNGKLDQRALPPLDAERPETVETVETTALSPVGELIAGLWCELLGLDRVRPSDSFFDLGGHSLLATQLVSRLEAAFDVGISLRTLFEAPTVAGLAARVEALLREGAGREAPPLRRVERQGPVPLSFAQERLWFLDRLRPGNPMYNLPLALDLRGPLSWPALAGSLAALAARHEALRTTLATVDGRPVQEIAPPSPPALPVVDLRGLSGDVRDAAVAALSAAEGDRAFDLERGPLLRATLLRLDDDRHVALFTVHHTVADGWSMGVLVREVGAFYSALAGGPPAALPDLPVQYADFAVWQRDWLRGEVLAEEIAWWRGRLSGAPPVLDLPLDRPRPAVHRFRGERRTVALRPGIEESLAALGRRHGATRFMTLLAAFQALLFRVTGQTDLPVGTPIAGRNRAEVEPLIGLFVNTLVLRGDASGDPGFGELLGRVRETALAAYAHQDLPFEKLVEGLAPERSLQHTPLFQVMFVLDEWGLAPPDLPGLRIEGMAIENQNARFDLTLIVRKTPAGLTASLGYNSDLFRLDTVLRLLGHFENLLDGALADPGCRVSGLPLLREAERHQLLFDWNDTARPELAADGLVHGLFEAWVASRPEAVAVLLDGESLSYGDLDRRAERLARKLAILGVGPEVRVGIGFERSFDLVTSILAVLKAGGAWVPLEPSHPSERLALILADAGARVLLTRPGLLGGLAGAGAVETLFLEEGWAAEPEMPEGPEPAGPAGPDGLAYVIYTSGSTGTPNGVLVSHRSAVNLIRQAAELYRTGSGDRVLQTASVGFDASVAELFLAFGHGASLCLVREEERLTPSVLAEVLVRQGVTAAVLTPAQLSVLPEAALGGLRSISVGGEACPADLAARWAPGRTLLNCYGPTEATVFATVEVCSGEGEPTIGRPVGNVEAHVLDASLSPVPIGVAGELVLGGVGVARGYLGLPEKTALKFLPDPFSVLPGARLYRTGDLARRRPDGTLEFLGRADDQVKVRGFRIELGEIEAALLRHPAVESAAVLAPANPADAAGARRLVGYVVLRPEGARPSAAELRGFLASGLPEYMVPPHVVLLDAMPLTRSGKVDRRALPDLESARPDLGSFVEPRDGAERFVAELWREVLGVERAGAEDDFFQLGGNSIKAAVLTNALQERLGEHVYVAALFDAPTVALLARYLRKNYPESLGRLTGERPEASAAPVPDTPSAGPARKIDPSMLARFRSLSAARGRAPKNPRALFLLSPPRSGSTLLRVMLAGHPGLFAPPELELLGFTSLRERRETFSGRNSSWSEGTIRALMEIHGCDGDEARRRMEEYEERDLSVRELYLEMQRAIGGRLLVDKTPSYSLDLAVLKRAEELFEEPLYIHLLRHPGGMIVSFEEARLEQVFFREVPDIPRRELAELTWLTSHQNILELLQDVPRERQVEVRFEDLVSEPGPTLERICRLAWIDFHPGMLDPYEDSSRRMTDGIHPLSKMVGDVKFHRHSGLDASVAERWRERLDERTLGDLTWEMAALLGYEPRRAPEPVREAIRDAPEGAWAPIQPLARGPQTRLPLSFAQQRLWFLDQLAPGSPAYNLPAFVRLRGPLSRAALEASLRRVEERHEVLRTVFVSVDGEASQVVSPAGRLRLPCVDLTSVPGPVRGREVERLAAAELARPFDLTGGPVWRATLLALGAEEHAVLVTMHHIASDGWSMGVLVREIGALYPALAEGRDASLAALPIQYADFAAWQRSWLEGEVLERHLSWWRDSLAGAPAVLDLPFDRPRPAAQSFRGALWRTRIDAGVARGVESLGRAGAATPFMVLLAAFQVLLSRLSGQDDVVVGAPVAGRNRPELQGLIGFFVNTLPLRARLEGDPVFQDVLARVRSTVLGAFAHEELPFEKLVDELSAGRTLAYSPLFQVAFALQNLSGGRALRLPGLVLEPVVEGLGGSSKFDLGLSLAETPEGLGGVWEYNTDLFDEATVARLAAAFERLLAGIVPGPAGPGPRLSDLPLLSEPERVQLLADWSGAEVPPGAERCLHGLFAEQVARDPDATAAICGDESLSYGELDRRSTALARRLAGLGVGLESRVGLLSEPSIGRLVGVLAVLKAGAAWVPLDPDHPPARTAWVLESSGMAALLAQESLRPALPVDVGPIPILPLDADWTGPDAEPVPAGPDSTAYVIYTSGSTGRPNGVLVPHRGAAELIVYCRKLFGLGPGSRVTHLTSFTFDASVLEIFLALGSGAALVVARPEERLGAELAELARRRGVTMMVLTPPVLAGLPTEGLAVEVVTVGGDRCPADLARRWSRRVALYNCYGPTETTIFSVHGRLADEPGEPPIGRAVAGTEIYVLDAEQRLVPPGSAGELCLGGAGVTRGYLEQPAKTAERFIPHPFASAAGARLYRTGDLVRFRRDGRLEFLGRIDSQVKIRGLRIEPGEVEEALREHPGVREAVVGVVERDGEKRLVAWVTPSPSAITGNDPAPNLGDHLRERLPSYMIPSAIVGLAALPVTVHGKIDRRALPEPEWGGAARKAYEAPKSAAERLLAEVWAELLRLDRVGVRDNFFELGGDSILSIQAVARAAKAGLRITARQIFEHQTIGELAAVAGRAEESRGEQGAVVGTVVLTPVQRLFLEPDPVDPHHFNQSVLLAVRPPVTPALARAAFAALLSHHDALRLRFRVAGDGGWQAWNEAPEGLDRSWSHLDLSALPESTALEAAAAQVQASLDLEAGPIARAVWLDLPGGEARLFLVVNHLAVDGVSWRVLLEDLETALRGLALPAKTTSFREWAARLEAHAANLEPAAIGWWRREAAIPAASLPVDHPGTENTAATLKSLQVSLGEEETRLLLQEVPAAYRTRIDEVLLTALVRTLAPASALRVDLEGHGREEILEGVDLSRTVGWFTSVYPVRLEAGGGDLGEALKAVKEHLRSVPDRGLSWGLLRWLRADGAEALGGLPVPEVSFNYLGQLDQALPEGSPLAPAPEPNGPMRSPRAVRDHLLDVAASVTGGRLRVAWMYGGRLHDRATVESWAERFLEALRELIGHCRSRVAQRIGGYTASDFPLARLAPGEPDRLLGPEWGIEDVYPLSPLQEGILFESLYAPGSGVYVEQLLCRLEGDLDAAAFERACRWTVERHAVLRTSFHWRDLERPLQVVHGRAEARLERLDWRGLSAAEREERLANLVRTDRERGLDLSTPPLMRWTLATAESESWLLWTHHHLLLDGWSFSAVAGELLGAWRALRSGAEPAYGRRRPYRDFIAWLESRDLGETERYWRRTLDGWTEPTPIIDSPSPERGQAQRQRRLPAAATEALRAQARRHQLTLNTLVQAAWGLLLGRTAGVDDVVFGTTVSGRPADLDGVESMVGLFINTLPVRLRLSGAEGEPRLLPWLAGLQRDQVEMRQHEHSPLVKVQAWSELPRGTALFETSMVFESYPMDAAMRDAAGGGEALGIAEVRALEQPHYPLGLAAVPGDELSLSLSYDRARFDEAAIEGRLGHLEALLTGMARALEEGGEIRLSALPMLSAAERRQLLADWSGALASEAVEERCLHELFEEQAARTPTAAAVVCGEESLSYGELERRSALLARRLAGLGVGPEARVGLLTEPSIERIVGLLGVLRAGAAYVPLDPEHPPARLAWIVESSGMELLLAQESLRPRAPSEASVPVLSLEEPWTAPAGAAPVRALPSNLACVIYTSGSTGRPKGVLVSHRSVAGLARVMRERFGIGPASRVSHVVSFTFDPSVLEILLALSSGASLVVARAEGRAGEALSSLLRERRVTFAQIPTAVLGTVDPDGLESLETLIMGGERCPAGLARRWASRVALINCYGPTEATVCAVYGQVADEPGEPPIGRPVEGAEVYLLDRRLDALPAGSPGELCLGGTGLTRGYLGEPARTAERFVPNPYAVDPGARLYRTGDLARFRPDGRLEFLGRIDAQVKIRGQRVELGEIESVLREAAGVRDAALGLVESRLVAWVVVDEPGMDLRPWLQERLPSYMVPSAFVELQSLPLTAHGKLDRRALPDPERSGPERGRFEAPGTEAERRLAEVWAELLKVERVGVHDNFFELGGDSILSIQAVSRAARSGLRITPRQLFEHPTIAELARIAGVAETSRAEQGEVTGPVVLTPIQRLFLEADPAEPHHFNQAVMLRMHPTVTVEVARQAFESLLRHHDALRLRFERGAEGWVQWNAGLEGLERSWSRMDLSSVEQVQTSLDLSTGPIARGVWLDLPGGEARLLLVVHHLAVDGVSWRILLEDLEAACRQLLAGEPVRLPPKTTSFREWSERLSAYADAMAPEAVEAELAWWRRETSAPAAALPVDFPGGENTGAALRSVSVSLSAEETRALLQDVPAAYRTRIDDVLLTALARALAPGGALRIELERHGREEVLPEDAGVDLSRTVGWFTSVYPVRIEAGGAGGDDPGEALKRVKEHLRAIPGRGLGWTLLRCLRADGGVALAGPPRPVIAFNYLGQFDQALPQGSLFTFAGESSGSAQSPLARREHLLNVNALVAEGRLRLDWVYGSRLHRRFTVEGWVERFLELLRELIGHCRSRAAQRIGGYTPSDFPLARLEPEELDRLVGPEWGIEEIHPLSPLQEGMLFETLFAPRSGAYVEQLLCRLEGDLDEEALEQACRWTVERHAVLRASFHGRDQGRPLQVVHSRIEVRLKRLDWRDQPDRDRLDGLMREDRERGFDPAEAPLMRWTLVRTGERERWLLWTHHHLLLDGWSFSAVAGELLGAYAALRSGGEPRFGARRPYRDYVAWLESRDLAETERYWRRTLAGWTEPTPLAESPWKASGQGQVRRIVPRPRTAAVQARARAHQLTLNTLVQGAWGLLLGRMAGVDDVVFGATVSGRPPELAGVESMVGLFINTLPVRLRLGSSSLLPWLQELQQGQAELRQHEHSPLVKVQAWSDVPRGRSLFDSILVFESYPIDAAMREAGGGENGLGIVEVRAQEQTHYGLTLAAGPGEEMLLALGFDRSRFDEASVGRMLGHLESLLADMARALEADGEAALSSLSLLNDAERHQLLVDWNDTARDLSREPVHERFARQAARTPEAVALSYGDEVLSYEELDRRSNRVAHALRRRGAAPGAIVGLSLERSLEMVVGLLGIWKAGGAYLPLDPAYPPERLSFLKEDAGVEVVLTREIVAEEGSDEALAVPSDLAYVIHTSGSTGRPKGVLVGHAQLAHTLSASLSEMGWHGSDRIACLAPFSFDIFLFELLNPLLSGGRCDLVSISPGPDMERLSELLPELTRLHAVPALMRQIVESVETPCPRMRTLFVGG
ncbi:MAG: non-ribosomal peptide synthase/polyketide synthase, partial [Acidobacteriota bacterium]